jgi:superfamily II DNA/RNA helicase
VKKAIYLPTNQNTIIISEFNEYAEILLDGEYKTVSKSEIEEISQKIELSSLEKLKENIYLNCIHKPLSDIFYSYNSNRLIPEPHQYKPLIKFLNSDNNRVLIADEVGLGKTIEAGMIFKEIDSREDLRISLIVVPSSLTIKWQEEFNIRFDEYFEIKKTNQFLKFIEDFENFSSSKTFNEKIIISYHTLRDERVLKKLKDSLFEVDFLIMDEAHTMRNNDTSTFESGEVITSISEHIIFLTATPVQNSLLDLFNILYLLDDDYFRDYEYFQKMVSPNGVIHKTIALIRNNNTLESIQHFVSENLNENYPKLLIDTFQKIITLAELKSENRVEFIDELTKSDHLSFIINRSKKKDVGRLIPRNAKSAIVDITSEEQNYYNAVINFVKFLNPDTPQGFITIMPERMASSSMLASLENFKEIKKSGKLFLKDFDDLEEIHPDIDMKQEALKYLDNVIIKGCLIGDKDSKFIKFLQIIEDLHTAGLKQIIVFSFFKFTLNYLEKKMIDFGYRVGKIHGDFSVEERYAKIKDFKNGDFDILLSSEVGSEGLDMQFANVIVNYDLPWNPMRVEQRIGRIDRIGQKFDKLHIFNLCIAGSIEDRIYLKLYDKLNIFENSIGELEPILGDLEKQLDIPKLITLSQKEIDEVINIKELSLKRQELEIKTQNIEVERLISDDYQTKEKQSILFNSNKIQILQHQTKVIFIQYLKDNNIEFIKLKDETLKLSNENRKKLIAELKKKLSDKKTNPIRYKEERSLLHMIYKYKDLRVSFATNNNDNFQTLYLFLNNPIIRMIASAKNYSTMYSTANNPNYPNKVAVIYRADFKQQKPKSIIKTLILDNELSFIDELDYFEFISNCTPIELKSNVDFGKLKSNVTHQIVRCLEKYKISEIENQTRIIDIKINSVKSYFEKQINRASRMEEKVLHEDVKRMKIGEIDNLKNQRDKKINDLEKQKNSTSSFEILGLIELK